MQYLPDILWLLNKKNTRATRVHVQFNLDQEKNFYALSEVGSASEMRID